MTVCHTPGKRVWARDDDGDGIREVHVNTIEGLWTGLRNFLRPFRGVSKIYLQQYLAVHEWAHNLKRSLWTFFEFYVASHTSPHEPRVLRTFFEKKRLAMLPEIYALLGTTSRMTVFRRLRELDYLSSFSHVGRYYTLPCVANFDPQGPVVLRRGRFFPGLVI